MEFDRYYVRYESEYLEHDVEGKFMLVEDHLAIVEKLKAEIANLAAVNMYLEIQLEEEYERGYHRV
jgi:hypothetical protein